MKRTYSRFIFTVFILLLIDCFFSTEKTIANNASHHFSIFENSEFADAASNISESNNQQDSEAKQSFLSLEKSGNYTSSISPSSIVSFPVGIRENRNGIEYGLVVTKATFKAEYAEIDVFARIVTPQNNGNGKQELYFGAQGVKLSYNGNVIGDAHLSLLGDINIYFNGGDWLLTLLGGTINKMNEGMATNENTYLTIDCNGIKDLSLKGKLQISRKIVVPVDQSGHVIEGSENRVKADFFVKANDWNDLLLETSISPFAITAQTQNTNKGHFSFMADHVVIDLSDSRNSSSMKFPDGYVTGGYLAAGEQSWRGIYIENLAVKLPAEFKTSKSNGETVSFSSQHLILDNYGVSGSFAARNVFSIQDGRTSERNAWAYSLESISVNFRASKITGGALSGKICLPTSAHQKADDTNGLGYKGTISENDYMLSVSLTDTASVSIMGARAHLLPNSTIELKVKNKEFRPRAILNGQLELAVNADGNEENQSASQKDLKIKELEFQNLTLESVSPFVSVTNLGAKGDFKIVNFPATVNDIQLSVTNRKTDLGFGIRVGLQDNGFSAGGTIHVDGEIAEDDGLLVWNYKGFRLSKLILKDVDVKVATLSGELDLMRNDPLYGNGFKATLNARITAFSNTAIAVNAIFGYSTFRYWGFEASVSGLNIPAGPVFLTGFTGGAFYRMLPKTGNINAAAMSFVPDKTIGLALRAGATACMKEDKLANFMAAFNISTNASGGLSQLGFVGEANFLCDLSTAYDKPFDTLKEKFKTITQKSDFVKDITEGSVTKNFFDVSDVDKIYSDDKSANNNSKSNISAKVAINYDFNIQAFHASALVYINTPGGLLTGTQAGGLAGEAVIHADKNNWYIHIGTPSKMIGIKIGIKQAFLRAESYLMAGTNIPDAPAPPKEVARLLGITSKQADYMKSLNELGLGKGFAFGSHFTFDTGEMNALILYAAFKAGIGADIMLKDYQKAQCNQSKGQIGINGWYANGQCYAYLQGELGVKVKIFGIKKKLPIITSSIASLLEVSGPNPYWMKGYLAGSYNLLGGMVKGKYNFELELGETCQLKKAKEAESLNVIADVSPANDDKNVSVFAEPQATFLFKVNSAFDINEDDGPHTYKIVIDKFSLTDHNGNDIKGKSKLAETGDALSFAPTEALPSGKKLKLTIEASFMEKKNGIFQIVTTDGQKMSEKVERYFTTGEAPDNIPLSNIEYAYPVPEQENFYTGESRRAIIKLRRGQSYLFENQSWTTSVIFQTEQNETIQAQNFRYNSADNTIGFDMPALKNKTNYKLALVSAAKKEGSETVNQQQNLFADNEAGTTMMIDVRKAQTLTGDASAQRLAYKFSTSRYNTLSDKLKAMQFSTAKGFITDGLVYLVNNTTLNEYFDITELKGSTYTNGKPLMQATAIMDDGFANKFKELFYNGYPVDGIILDRDADTKSTIGIPPAKALPAITQYINYLELDKNNPLLLQIFPYRYDLFRYYRADWYDILNKAINKYLNIKGEPQRITDIKNSSFGIIPAGKYNVLIQYILPDGNSGTTTTVSYDI